DPSRDLELRAQRRRLDALGASELPVLRVGRAVFCGEARLDDALLALRLLAHRPRATRRTG
ncbi:MAG: hypothetical protein M3P39_06220, partial [Actinomycetota bacterium]|nr:hypothetical protein [Actinomycetota bacterium]